MLKTILVFLLLCTSNLIFSQDSPTAVNPTPVSGLTNSEFDDVKLTVFESAGQANPADNLADRESIADFINLFGALDYGTDGAGSTTFGLSIPADGIGTGLFALDANASNGKGAEILLFDTAGFIEGRTNTSSGVLYFTISNTGSEIILNQSANFNIWHPENTNHNDIVSLNVISSGSASVTYSINLVQIITDAHSDSAVLNLAEASASAQYVFNFLDDDPTISDTVDSDSIKTVTDDANTKGANIDSDTAKFAAVFENAVVDLDAGAPVPVMSSDNYALAVTSPDIDSGLTHEGEAITLSLNVAGDVVGTTATHGDVFTISVVNTGVGAGDVTLTQIQEIDHDTATPGAGEGLVRTLADNLVSLTANVTATSADGDNDSVTITESVAMDLGGNIAFNDDVPTISDTVDSDSIKAVTDDANTKGADSDLDIANFAAVFENAFDIGADDLEAGAPVSVMSSDNYVLGVTNSASGLTHEGEAITLSLNGAGDVVGTTATHGDVFTISVVNTGVGAGDVTLTQIQEIDHDTVTPGVGEGLVRTLADNLVSLTAEVTATGAVTDGDGDSATITESVAMDLGGNIAFNDDGPTVVDPDSIAGVKLTVDETTLTTNASASFAGVFTETYGADGVGSVDGYALGVSIAGADSGLVDTATGNKVFLFLESDVVVGREGTDATAAATGAIVLNINVDAGLVTLDQVRAIVHSDTSNPDDSSSSMTDNLITLAANVTDGDGDTANVVADIAGSFIFKDDGPTLVDPDSIADVKLTVDETTLTTNASASFAGVFTETYGADGVGSVGGYALGVSIAGADSGLLDTATGNNVFLFLEGTTVVGREGTDATAAATGAIVLNINADAAAGLVTLDQVRAIVHSDTSNPDDSSSSMTANLITLAANVTDGDGDTANVVADITGSFIFKDDGPTAVAPTSISEASDIVFDGAKLTVDESAGSQNLDLFILRELVSTSTLVAVFTASNTYDEAPVSYAIDPNSINASYFAINQCGLVTLTYAGVSEIETNAALDSLMVNVIITYGEVGAELPIYHEATIGIKSTNVMEQLKIDLDNMIAEVNSIVAGEVVTPFPGGTSTTNATIKSGVYSQAARATFGGNISFDGEGDANSIFIFKTSGTIDTTAGTVFEFINGATANNILFVSDGSVTLGAGSDISGTFITTAGTITIGEGVNLEGRGLSIDGSINNYGNINVPTYDAGVNNNNNNNNADAKQSHADFNEFFSNVAVEGGGTTSSYGADGAGLALFSLKLNITNGNNANGSVGSGIYALTNVNGKGSEILLFDDNVVIKGMVDNDIYFTVTNNGSKITLTETSFGLWYNDGAVSLKGLGGDSTVDIPITYDINLNQTITDADGDSAISSLSLIDGGGVDNSEYVFSFKDDGPQFDLGYLNSIALYSGIGAVSNISADNIIVGDVAHNIGALSGFDAADHTGNIIDNQSIITDDGPTVVDPAAPTAGTAATYCDGDPMIDLTASGSGGTLNWYDDAGLTNMVGTGGSLTPAGTLGATTYYVTETVTGCSSLPATVTITINPIPAAPAAGTNATYCFGEPMVDLTATAAGGGTLTWYDNAGLTNTVGTGTTFSPPSALGSTTYYVTETVVGCESPSTQITITVNPTPAAPIAGTDATYCDSDPIIDLVASGGGGNLNWYDDAGLTNLVGTGGTLTPSGTLGATTYYVTETSGGCLSLPTMVTITINPIPAVPTAAADIGSVGEGALLTVLAADGVLANDASGADDWTAPDAGVVGVVAGSDANIDTDSPTTLNTGIAGTYGTLILQADGSYTYQSTANEITGNETDTFVYTVKDGDGDLTSETLTINLSDVTVAPVNTAATEQANEAGLSDGSSAGDDSNKIIDGSLNLPSELSVASAQSGTASFGDWNVDTDGTFDYTLTTTITDVDGTDETDSFTYEAQDANGNTVSNTVSITIIDDGPIVTNNQIIVVVEEEELAGGNEDTTDVNGLDTDEYSTQVTANATGSLESLIDAGADGYGGFSFDLSDPVAFVQGLGLTSNGDAINDATLANGLLIAKAGVNDIFSLELESSGSYIFTLLDQMDHHSINFPDNLEDALSIDFSDVLKFEDADGDSVMLTSGMFQIKVIDDSPEAYNDNICTDSSMGNVANGNVVDGSLAAGGLADNYGADGAGQLISFEHDGTVYSATSYVTFHTITTADGGTFIFYFEDVGVNVAGNFEYTASTGTGAEVTEVFTYTLRDADGDTASANLEICVDHETLAIEDLFLSNLNYYPNPVVNTLHINNVTTIIKIIVYDINGKKLLEKIHQSDKVELKVDKLKIGVYFLKVYSKDRIKTIKIIKGE